MGRFVERGVFALQELEKQVDESLQEYRRKLGLYGHCELCGVQADVWQDHDHSNGLIRGTLCQHCNVGLGFFKDDTFRLAQAIEYLRKWQDVHFKLSKQERKKFRYYNHNRMKANRAI
jgi:hypothetical protein